MMKEVAAEDIKTPSEGETDARVFAMVRSLAPNQSAASRVVALEENGLPIPRMVWPSSPTTSAVCLSATNVPK